MTIRGVLVVGATGTQGGAVARRLLADDREIDVYALTRDPSSTAARKLAEQGAIVVKGDLWKPHTLVDAIEPVDAVFAVTDYWEAGFDGEVTQGINVANVAARADVDHFVFSSVAGADQHTQVPVLDAKARIERHVRRLDLPATILRPSYFMQNFELRREDVTDGTLALPLAPGTRLPLTDAADVGRLVARLLETPAQYQGAEIPVASEEVTLGEMAEAFGAALHREMETVHIPIDVVRSQHGDAYARLFEWYNRDAPAGLVAQFKRHVDFAPTPLSAYLDRTDWTRPALPESGKPQPAQ
ncbi:NmrA/HSCARG family protein [Halorientalis brevis]|uniref:NmrA/HSCARG family protein n=1 Tax=Halorientalis brevis TaxID=1126241 RepID=A0ABD6C6X3_9EURY|nr:NmrA/HSCARG family protein [Halorientalis brevis]